MFGYATNETTDFMPAAIYYSHRLVEQQAKVRKSRHGCRGCARTPSRRSRCVTKTARSPAIDAVVLSTQHDPDVKHEDLIEGVREQILKPVLPAEAGCTRAPSSTSIRPASS